MPKLRRLSGKQVIRILEGFGFAVFNQRGRHVRLQRITVEGEEQRIVVAVHGSRPISTGTLHAIYREACAFIPEHELRPHFYTD